MDLIVADLFQGYPDRQTDQTPTTRSALVLCARVNLLLNSFRAAGFTTPTNPKTQCLVSGEKDGGWRPPECPVGAPNSAHKQGQAVDIFDPDGHLDDWLTDEVLARFDLYREHPSATRGWCHLTTRPPASGRRSFYP